MKQILKRLGTIGLITGFTFVVSACGSDEAAEAEEPLSGSQENDDVAQEVYDETYDVVYSHITENYDEAETVELCEQTYNFEQDFDYTAFIEGIMDEVGVQVEGDSRADPEYRGAFDATDAVSWDICADQA